MRMNLLPFKQEGVQMYAGVMPISDLLTIARVDVWHQEDGSESGYQRSPETARTGKVARYLQSDPKPLMPTSVVLSYRGKLPTSAFDGMVTLEIPDEDTLWIVDGQHRIYGFEKAINDLGIVRLQDYLLPIVIVENPSLEDEANQFRVINETMKKVRTDLARRILALRVATLGKTGRQQIRSSGRLWEATSVDVIKELANNADSPWAGRIQAPNLRKQPDHVIRELSFSTSLKPLLNEFPYRQWTAERIAKTLKDYWESWKNLVPEAFEKPDEYVLLKTPGVFSLHIVLVNILNALRSNGVENPEIKDFTKILKDLDDYATAEFWRKDNSQGAAMAGSMKGFAILADAMEEELTAAGHVA